MQDIRTVRQDIRQDKGGGGGENAAGFITVITVFWSTSPEKWRPQKR